MSVSVGNMKVILTFDVEGFKRECDEIVAQVQTGEMTAKDAENELEFVKRRLGKFFVCQQQSGN
jgi:hypothetical protein